MTPREAVPEWIKRLEHLAKESWRVCGAIEQLRTKGETPGATLQEFMPMLTDLERQLARFARRAHNFPHAPKQAPWET